MLTMCMSLFRLHRPEYNSWLAMRNRTRNEFNPAFPNYGGRGITVIDRWYDSFAEFLADMGKRPSARHTLDRIDNDQGYSPANCRWADWTTQNSNKRPKGTGARPQSQKRPRPTFTWNGEEQSIDTWLERAAITRAMYNKRMWSGWPQSQALGLTARQS